MNVNIIRLGPLTKETARQADALERVALCLEAICSFHGIRLAPIASDELAGEPEVSYQTDEATAIREAEEEAIRLGYRPMQEQE